MEHGNFEMKAHPRDLRLTRLVKAPRTLVFEAFTKAEHLVHWWAPGGFTMPACEVDLRVGGSWRYTFRSPEGLEHHCYAKYLQVEPPRKLVMTQEVPDATGKPIFRIQQTVTLAEKGEMTEVLLEAKVLLPNLGSEPYLGGMEQGTNQTMDNLAVYIGSLKGG